MKKIFTALKFFFSFLIIFFLFKKIQPNEVFPLFNQFNKWILLLAFLIFIVDYCLGLLRWWMLLRVAKVQFSFKRLVIVYFGSQFFNLFLPSTIGGDVARSLDLGTQTNKLKTVAATVFLDRLSGYIGLVLVASVSVLFGFRFIDNRPIYTIIIALTLFTVIIVLFLLNKKATLLLSRFLNRSGRLSQKISSLYQEIANFHSHKYMLLANILVSVVIQFLIPLMYWTIACALGVRFSFLGFLIMVPLITIISTIPVFIAGLGGREWGSVVLLGQIGVGENIALALSLTNFLFMLLSGIFGGILYVFTFRFRRLQHNK